MAELLDAGAARNLTEQIKRGVSDLLPLIRQAFDGRADVALGYVSWAEYCDAELRGLRIPVQDRREAVQTLRGAGMSTRAIGAALGSSEATVRRDLSTASFDAVPVRGLDGGREQPASRPVPVEVSAAVRDALDEHSAEVEQRQADRKALDDLAGELGLAPDPNAEAEENERIALLYPMFDAIRKLATMPDPRGVVIRIKPYERHLLDELPAGAAWLDGFVEAWKDWQ